MEEALADTNRCLQALMKEFPTWVFVSVNLTDAKKMRIYFRNDTDCPNNTRNIATRAFARGFVASAHLWER